MTTQQKQQNQQNQFIDYNSVNKRLFFSPQCRTKDVPAEVLTKATNKNFIQGNALAKKYAKGRGFEEAMKAQLWKTAFAGPKAVYLYLVEYTEEYHGYVKYLVTHGATAIVRIKGHKKAYMVNPVCKPDEEINWAIVEERLAELTTILKVGEAEKAIELYVQVRNVSKVNAVLRQYNSPYRIPTEQYPNVAHPLTKDVIESMKITVKSWANPLDLSVTLDGQQHFTSNMAKDALAEKNRTKNGFDTLDPQYVNTYIAKAVQKDVHGTKEDLGEIIKAYYTIQDYLQLVKSGALTYEDIIDSEYSMCSCGVPVSRHKAYCPHCETPNPNYNDYCSHDDDMELYVNKYGYDYVYKANDKLIVSNGKYEPAKVFDPCTSSEKKLTAIKPKDITATVDETTAKLIDEINKGSAKRDAKKANKKY